MANPITVEVAGDNIAIDGAAYGADARDGSFGMGIAGRTDGGTGVGAFATTSGVGLQATSQLRPCSRWASA
jgi:hypothetical protein